MSTIYETAAEHTGKLPLFDWDSLPKQEFAGLHRRRQPIFTMRRIMFTIVFILALGNSLVGIALAGQGLNPVQVMGLFCMMAGGAAFATLFFVARDY